ncbi:hypothetical protein [Pedobacter steynii]
MKKEVLQKNVNAADVRRQLHFICKQEILERVLAEGFDGPARTCSSMNDLLLLYSPILFHPNNHSKKHATTTNHHYT